MSGLIGVTMGDERVDLLDQALVLTLRMLEQARAGEWQTVIGQEAERRRLLERAFATREPLNDVLAERVRHILELDRELIEASTRLRDDLGGEISQLNRAGRASNAYQANAG